MEASMLQQASQWRGAVGCRQGVHQFLGNPSHGLSPAGWMARGGIGQPPVQTVGAVPCRAGCQITQRFQGNLSPRHCPSSLFVVGHLQSS